MSEIFVFCVPDNVFRHLTLADNFFTIKQQAVCARVPLLHMCVYRTSDQGLSAVRAISESRLYLQTDTR